MDEQLKRKFSPVKDEMYQLLLSAYCYKRKVEHLSERLKSESREFLLEEATALRHLSNGMILHICNLDDDSSAWSMRAMTKDLGKTKQFAERARDCSDILKKYRAQINGFKTKYRNQFIAHRNGEDYPNPFNLPDYRTEFREIIQTGLSALEQIWGNPLEFGFDLGSREPTIDFKKELGVT
ncbi:hypothetical protein I5R65_21660 [Herbaspirillum sp. AP02]|uniref:hypothetical protein n=1 Tax=unclassified Herbaspirillum TaxID=2624150 RepID=UPI0015DA560B|nr:MULTISPECIES: hypothetical protein [unclassified Herbaspirillum]MBG7622088.1 hypothetical protein [Herbaspirillum sp. AP02]NZD69107.1 hypothetical protein [Herbaspirillum sp. AP21]